MEVEIVQGDTGGVSDIEAQISTPQAGGWLYTLVGFILGPVNRSNPIWLLRLLSLFCLVVAVNGSALLLPDYLRAAHSTYQRVIFIASFGSPVAVAAISLVLSFWMASDPTEWATWTTGLSVATASISGGGLCLYFVLPRGN